jgi:acetyltransferase-like isoleucine patch superfamily enzyme
VKLDSARKIDIGDNVFIGCGIIFEPKVTISRNALVVPRDVPARAIGLVEDLVKTR